MKKKDKLLPKLYYIHGANASPLSFSYISMMLPEHEAFYASYDCESEHLEQNIKLIKKDIIDKIDGNNFIIIGHSLGGIIGYNIAKDFNSVLKLITISTPFGGVKISDYLKIFYRKCKLFEDTSTSNELLKQIREYKLNIPIKSIITSCAGIPVMGLENDGVVTIESQKMSNAPDDSYVHITSNHFEALLNFNVVEILKDFIFKV